MTIAGEYRERVGEETNRETICRGAMDGPVGNAPSNNQAASEAVSSVGARTGRAGLLLRRLCADRASGPFQDL
jgi:hypothetical protein